jgi:hypothetical protein
VGRRRNEKNEVLRAWNQACRYKDNTYRYMHDTLRGVGCLNGWAWTVWQPRYL